MDQTRREPIFNVPSVVFGLIAVLVVVQLGREMLSDDDNTWVILAFAFIPARFGELAGALPGAPWAGPVSFFSHAFLHADFTHLIVNSAWLLAVGTPVARRVPPALFLAFWALCGIGGALLFLVAHVGLAAPMVGASGAVSGMMGAVFRLMFAADDAGKRYVLRENPMAAPRLSLRSTFTSRQSLTAIAVWVGVNLVAAIGLGGLTSPGGVAWEAHLGGFFTGLLAFSLFDRGNPSEQLS